MPRWLGMTMVAASVTACAALQGCREAGGERDYQTREGVIERIDLAESEVTFRYYSKKHDREIPITGKATAETEVIINGVLSSLADLREGERVTVTGWVRGHGTDREVVAVTVQANRAATIRRQPQPTSAPAQEASPGPEAATANAPGG